MLVLK